MATACIEQGWSACDARLREVPAWLADASVSVRPEAMIVLVVRSSAPHCRIPECHGFGDPVCTEILNVHVRRKGPQRRCNPRIVRSRWAPSAMPPDRCGAQGRTRPRLPQAASPCNCVKSCPRGQPRQARAFRRQGCMNRCRRARSFHAGSLIAFSPHAPDHASTDATSPLTLDGTWLGECAHRPPPGARRDVMCTISNRRMCRSSAARSQAWTCTARG